MAGKLSIDFGTCNTVVALWDAEKEMGGTLHLPGFSQTEIYNGSEYHVNPTLIHYEKTRVRIGRQVVDDNLQTAKETFNLLKTYIGNGLRLTRNIGDRRIDTFQAGKDFLVQILLSAGEYTDFANEEVAFAVPVEAFEHYQNWLDDVAQEAGVLRPLFIDEPSAAALGYKAGIRTGKPYLVFDFGGGTIDASIVIPDSSTDNLRCRVLGKAGAQMGGSNIDQWIVRYILERTGKKEAEVRSFLRLLLDEAERVKKELTFSDETNFTGMNPATGSVIEYTLRRTELEDILDANELYTKVNTVLDMVEAQAVEKGYDRTSLQACLMIGGSSLIPSIGRQMRMRYGKRTHCENPFDAVALGASAYAAGAGFDDRIRHEYALKPYDRKKNKYVIHSLVPAGTPYPCQIMRPDEQSKPLILTVKASNEEQTRLGIQVYEVAHNQSAACGGGGFDLVFDANGCARYTEREDVEDFCCRPIGSATFITANPPAKMHDPRFTAAFAIDAQKRLCITVRDLQTGKIVMRDYPMVKLT